MRCARPVLIAAAAGLLLAGLNTRLLGQASSQPPGDFKAKLDEALAKLATYDFGGDSAGQAAITELVTASYGKPDQRKELASRLAAMLASGAPRGAKVCVCRQLSIVGTASEVPALAALLADEQLSHMSRYALERIPGPAATDALRLALGKVKGKLLVGVLNSLGNRQDAAAVGDLAGLLGDADPAVAAAAAAALGKIGPPAAGALGQALGSAPAAVRPAVADACLRCAAVLAAQGKRDEAVAMYDRLRGMDVSKVVRIAAMRGAILARAAGGAPLLVENLQGSDAELFGLACMLVREMPGPEVTAAAAAELGKLTPAKQVALLAALADRGDRAAAPAVVALAKGADAKTRPAAILALARLGDAAAVPVLFEAALGGEGDLAQAARAALASLPGKDVDAAVTGLAGGGEVKLRRAAIETLGQRRVAAATPLLLTAAAEADESIRLAALRALGDTAGPQDVAALVALLVGAKAPGEIGTAEGALRAACGRLPDRDPAAQALAAGLPQAGAEQKAVILRVLGQVSGAKALEAVCAAIKEANEGVRDTAVRVLSEWPDAAAIPDLAVLAKASESRKYQILALRGYIRLIGQSDLPADKKLATCKEAMGLAQRDEEKKLVLGVLGGVPSPEALAMVAAFLDNPSMKDEAAAAAVAVGDKIAGSHPKQVAEAMKKTLKVTANKDLQKRAEEVLGRAGGK